MKNQFLCMVIIYMTTIGCTKININQDVFNSEILSKDIHFINLIDQEMGINKLISQIAIKNNISISDLKYQISINPNYVNQILKKEELNQINVFIQTFKYNYNQLNLTYKNITVDQIEDACKKYYKAKKDLLIQTNNNFSNIKSNVQQEFYDNKDCGWRFSLCMAGAAAASIVCHASCIGATAGFGTPVCVLLCSTIEVAAGVACIDNYCPLK